MTKRSKSASPPPVIVDDNFNLNIPADFEVQAAGHTLNIERLHEMRPAVVAYCCDLGSSRR
jgi:hypothetical protein